MEAALDAFRSGFPSYLLYTGLAGLLLLITSAVYVLLTPWKELALLKGGNGTAGLALAGAILGLAIPLAANVASSSSIMDFLIWSVISLLMQLIAYRLTDAILRDLPRRIEQDEAGAAIVLISVKLSTAMILAAGLWDPNVHMLRV
jgi:putative membrane protein